MRPSNRSKILDAAVRVIHRDGVTGITFDSVAAESGVTRGGMMYHFPSREALVQALHQHLAEQWETSLELSAGKPRQDTSPQERAVAYARTSAQSATRAELLFLLDASNSPELAAPWDRVLDRWAPPAPESVDDQAALSRFIARLAADGLWIYESLSSQPLPADIRQKVAEHLAQALQGDPADALVAPLPSPTTQAPTV